MEGVGSQVETDVDTLVSLVKQKGRLSLEQAAKALHKPMATIQTWVDFLVEEGVLGIEYKFVTPYLYFNKDLKKKPSVLEEEPEESIEDKSSFYEKAKAKGLEVEQINQLWKDYLNNHLQTIREHFHRKAAAKNFSEAQTTKLWKEYYEYLIKEEK